MLKDYKIISYHHNLKLPLLEDYIFVESFFSSNPNGELYWFLKEIEANFPNYKIILSIKNTKDISEEILANTSIKKFVKRCSLKYYKYLATCKFLLSDMTFPQHFIKRTGQVYFNTWHGTPWKKLGLASNVKGKFSSISNTQKSFYLADKLVVNNDFNIFVFKNHYSINAILDNKFIKTSFLKNEMPKISTNKTKNILILYTWRNKWLINGTFFLNKILLIDSMVEKYCDYNFYFTLHHTLNNKRNKNWIEKNIKNLKFVQKTDTNTLMANSDSIITDYSSALFDAAYMKKRVVLDITDIDLYRKDTGLYNLIDLWGFDQLTSNFNVANSIQEAIKQAVDFDEPFNYDKFNEVFNKYQKVNCGSWVNDFLNYEKKESIDNGVLIYPGTLNINGITSSFIETVKILLENNKKVTIFLSKLYNNKKDVYFLRRHFKNSVDIIFSDYKSFDSLITKLLFYTYKNFPLLKSRLLKKYVSNYFKYEKLKIFGDMKFNKVINFSGYEWYITGLFEEFDDSLKCIYVHNDMISEYKTRKNFSKNIIFDAYDSYDKIIFPSKSLSIQLYKKSKIFKRNESKFVIVPNPVDFTIETHESLLNDIKMDRQLKKVIASNSNLYWDFQEIYNILKTSEINKIVFLGRMSYEKNVLMTLKSFATYFKKFDNKSFLFLISTKTKKNARNKPIYNFKIKWYLKYSKYRKNIIQIQGIKGELVNYVLPMFNVMLFLSKYEGQGLSAIESVISKTPVIASDIITSLELEEQFKLISTVINEREVIAEKINETIIGNNHINETEILDDLNKYKKYVNEEMKKFY